MSSGCHLNFSTTPPASEEWLQEHERRYHDLSSYGFKLAFVTKDHGDSLTRLSSLYFIMVASTLRHTFIRPNSQSTLCVMSFRMTFRSGLVVVEM